MFLLFSDLDNLKWINDTFGHHEGDQALIETANIYRETFANRISLRALAGMSSRFLPLKPIGTAVISLLLAYMRA